MKKRFQFAIGLLAITAIYLAVAVPSSAGGYRDHARAVLTNLPQGVQLRPDLEALLDGHASRYRVSQGYGALTRSGLVRDAARTQAVEMLLGGYVGHHSPSGYRFRARFEAFAGDGNNAYAENAARATGAGAANAAKLAKLFRQWVSSRGHRRNMVQRSYRYVSSGVVQRGNVLYAVQIYFERLP